MSYLRHLQPKPKPMLFSMKSGFFSALLNHAAWIFCGVFLFVSSELDAQCADTESTIEVIIVADNWSTETSWDLLHGNDVIASGGAVGDTICLDASIEDPCLLFTIYDSYGDGIYAPGGYWIYQDGIEIATGNAFGYGETVSFDCAPGTTCNDAF